jgi:Flp pilus assembly CpaF family ATPase
MFSLPRKLARIKPKIMRHRLRITAISSVGKKAARCISIGHPQGLYITNDYVVTHNTTLVNAVIHELTDQFPAERLIIIEDTGEIQCAARNAVLYHTAGEVTMTKLLKTSMRMRPDRILVGEVRGAEALDLLMAWNTGHPGGIATLHANTASSGLTRLASLISMARDYPKPIEPLIGEAVDLIVHIAKENNSRRIKEILRVTSYNTHTNSYDITL